MFLESTLLLAFNVERWLAWPAPRLRAFYVLVFGCSVALLMLVETAGIAVFIAHVVAFLSIEFGLFFRDRRTTSYRWLLEAVTTFAASYLIWWLDKLEIVCDPKNHLFSGHAAWHLLGALSFYFWYRHYAQFELSRRTPLRVAH